MKDLLQIDKRMLTKNLNRIESFLYWKGSQDSVVSRLICPICDGDTIVQLDEALRYCKCATKNWIDGVNKMLDPYRSTHRRMKLEDIDTAIHPKMKDGLRNAIEWAKGPSGMMVISGGYGVGKSHIAQAIDEFYSPISLYITAADFESIVFRGVQEKTLANDMDSIRVAPILILDDIGMEYGSPIVVSQLDSVIDFRYRFPKTYPTIVITNYSGNELQTKGRYGSRIMDVDSLTYVGLSGVPDYRFRK